MFIFGNGAAKIIKLFQIKKVFKPWIANFVNFESDFVNFETRAANFVNFESRIVNFESQIVNFESRSYKKLSGLLFFLYFCSKEKIII